VPVADDLLSPLGDGGGQSRQAAQLNGARRVLRDGDLLEPAGPSAPTDGVLDQGIDPVIMDGADPQAFDTRSEQDRNAFSAPPAGFDPLLFQVEDIEPSNPTLNRRPRRLFTAEPYDPIGIRIGSFVLFPQSESGLSWYRTFLPHPMGNPISLM